MPARWSRAILSLVIGARVKLDEIIRPRREPGGFPAFWAGALGGLAVDRMDPAIGVPE